VSVWREERIELKRDFEGVLRFDLQSPSAVPDI
jgi:hypothetical protein